jgi:hypothetical protein
VILELVIAAVIIVLIVGMVRTVRRRTPRHAGPLPDVPDAPSEAAPADAPGVKFPYSSLDPYAPPKLPGGRLSTPPGDGPRKPTTG